MTRIAAVCILALLTLLSAPAAARAHGSIDGTVVRGLDDVPVADLDISLHQLGEDGPTELETTATDDGGRFTFDGVGTDVDVEVVLTFDDAEYRSGALRIMAGRATPVAIEVFDSTDSAEDVVVASWVVWVDRLNGVSIQHDLQVENRGERTYLGEDPDGVGTRAAIRVPLAPDAVGLRFLGRFTECCATMRGTDYVHTSPLVPGTTAGTLRYAVEALDTLSLPARLPVESFTMMVPEGVTVGTSQLELSGEIESQGNTYDVYTTEGLAAGETLELSFRGLTVPKTPIWQLAAAAAGVLLVGLAAASWWRRRGAAAPADAATTGSAPSGGVPSGMASEVTIAPAPAAASAPSGALPRSNGAPRLSAELLVDEIALLDVGFERGLLPREAYEPLREARKAELLELSPRTEG
jgi:hypothetical protein